MIEKIYHVADLHIRNLQRHKEYKSVFEKFLKQVKEDNLQNSIIYLAGDIAHAKTEMSPELIREISWFFTECAKLRDTFIITGNHDCNLNNDYRLDVLTPIVENLDNPRIHYLRDTGVYTHENLTFVVYSIMDHKDNWPSGYDVKGENTICLFHGPVNKAETDIGYTVSSNSFTADMFDGFDMALLGDIHKRQVVSNLTDEIVKVNIEDSHIYLEKNWKTKGVSNGKAIFRKKTAHAAYAGSIIQQNHGEMLEGHGYLLWDVKTRTFESFDIHNDYGYLTVDVVNGEIPQWVYDEIDVKLPKNPRLRLRFTNTPAAEMKLRITELKKLFKVAEVTVTRTDTMGQLRTNNKLNKNIVGDVTDITFQNQLIRDYLERRYLLEDKELDSIAEINKELNSELSKTDLAENILWTPKKLEFSNMFSYGEGNMVRFDGARGMIGIFAPNASGKSSLFDALSFCIYDKTSRTNVSKNILNNQKDYFYCKFNFEIDGVDYFIERKAKYVRKRTAVKVDVNFWKEDGGVLESLNGEQRRDTNANIEKYLGKFDDFVLTTLSLQGNNALFIDKSQSERK
jgi:DNA repair exonuclease SbcCD nuclease subunit